MSRALTPKQKVDFLKQRALMLSQARAFFAQRNVIEIDCPILNEATNIDDHIDPIEVQYQESKRGYLHTSPELFLKKLLALGGSEEYYFLGHVFRDYEKGDQHHIEFTMVEWYRLHLSFQQLIEETLDFIQLFTAKQEVVQVSYFEALYNATSLDYTQVTYETLAEFIKKHIDPHFHFAEDSLSDLLIYIFTEQVEPTFPHHKLTVLTDFPASQGALAKSKIEGGREVAKRFEIYFKGVELANGYDELQGSTPLLKRYNFWNEKRARLGKSRLKIDHDFIEANENLPDCRGVAVGFDRLMMLKLNQKAIHPSMSLMH